MGWKIQHKIENISMSCESKRTTIVSLIDWLVLGRKRPETSGIFNSEIISRLKLSP